MGGRVGGGVRVDVNEELKFLGKFTKKKFWGGGVRGRVGGVRVDVIEELKFLEKFTKKIWGGGGGGGVWGWSGWWGGHGGCEKNLFLGGEGGGRGRVGGVRVDVIEELKFLGKFTKKNLGGGGGGLGWWGGGGVRVDVNEELKFL